MKKNQPSHKVVDKRAERFLPINSNREEMDKHQKMVGKHTDLNHLHDLKTDLNLFLYIYPL